MLQFKMDVTVVGTGRVGLPLALSFKDKGLRVNGVDTDERLIESVRQGRMPFNEPGYDDILRKNGFHVGPEFDVVADSAYIIITVGTPLKMHIETDLCHIKEVLDRVTPHIRKGQTIILRSTVAPQTSEFVRKYLENRTGYKVGNAIFLAYCPERIAEGRALEELETLPQIIGCADPDSGKKAEKLFRHLVEDIFVSDFISAELSKLFCNISRYIYFAVSNHFMVLSDEFGANIFEILKMTNHKYPRQIIANPGLTAGTCLRKDFGMINEHIPYMDLLLGAWKVNEYIPNFLVTHILKRTELHEKSVAVLGYAFKKNSDDPRDSLTPKLVRYIQRQVPRDIRVCEPNFNNGNRLGNGFRNHTLEDALAGADVVFFATDHDHFGERMKDIFACCSPRTWFVDVWNLSGRGKMFYQKMEVSQ